MRFGINTFLLTSPFTSQRTPQNPPPHVGGNGGLAKWLALPLVAGGWWSGMGTVGAAPAQATRPGDDFDHHPAGQVLLDDRSSERGFQRIFNGKDLAGWDGDPRLWSVKDGAITGQSTAENPVRVNTFLIWTNGTVGDFELRSSFRLTPNNAQGFANSGIQYRSKVTDPARWVVGGYQADMEAGPSFTGILYEEQFRGIMALRGEKVVWDKDCKKEVVGSIGTATDIEAALKKGGWNDYVIIAQGNHLQQFINGKQTVDVTDDCEAKRAMSGVLALQMHVGGPFTAQFKDVRLKTLASQRGAADDRPQAMAGDLKGLQGTWQVASLESDGTAVPAEEATNLVLVIQGETYRVIREGEPQDSGTFTIIPAKQPKQMDVRPGNNPQGRAMPGIYELNSDAFRFCCALHGTERPTTFSTTPDSGQVLIVYHRKQ